MRRNTSTRSVSAMRRATDTHTATGRRIREHKPAPRRTGTRSGVVARELREAGR